MVYTSFLTLPLVVPLPSVPRSRKRYASSFSHCGKRYDGRDTVKSPGILFGMKNTLQGSRVDNVLRLLLGPPGRDCNDTGKSLWLCSCPRDNPQGPRKNRRIADHGSHSRTSAPAFVVARSIEGDPRRPNEGLGQ